MSDLVVFFGSSEVYIVFKCFNNLSEDTSNAIWTLVNAGVGFGEQQSEIGRGGLCEGGRAASAAQRHVRGQRLHHVIHNHCVVPCKPHDLDPNNGLHRCIVSTCLASVTTVLSSTGGASEEDCGRAAEQPSVLRAVGRHRGAHRAGGERTGSERTR